MWLCAINIHSVAQINSKLGKLYVKGKYEVFKKILAKSILKDSINPEAHYWYSVFYLTKGLKTYDIEQSYESIITSYRHYEKMTDSHDISKLSKLGINAISIDKHKRKIESDGYDRAKVSNTEDGYNYFIQFFSDANQIDSVKIFRNEVAFQRAKEINSYNGYENFMNKYPEAEQVPKARELFERLYFDERTKDGKLSSYMKFISDHPQSHYREIAEKNIFELSTLSGNSQDYINFISKYRKSPYVKVAMNVLYHLDQRLIRFEWAPNLADSLKDIAKNDKRLLFPFFRQGRYGFLTTDGLEVIPPTIEGLNSKHKCNLISNSIIQTTKNNQKVLLTLSGKTFWEGKYDEIEDFGQGVLTIYLNNKVGAIHKSGRQILEIKYDDVQVINNRVIAYKVNNKWGLCSFNGKVICSPIFDDVKGVNSYIIVTNNNKSRVLPYSEIENVAEGKAINPKTYYNEWEVLPNGDLFLSDNNSDYILSPFLKLRFSETVNRIEVHDSLFITTDINGKRLFSNNYQIVGGPYQNIKYNNIIIAVQKENEWRILSDSLGNSYDSLTIISDKLAVGHHGATSHFIFNSAKAIEVPEKVQYRILKNIKSIDPLHNEYLLVNDQHGFNFIYNENAELIYKGKAEKFEVVDNGLIVLEEKGMKGLINSKGKQLIPSKYDAIGNYNEGLISVLKGSRFGLFRPSDLAFIPTEYDMQIKSYHEGFFIVHKDSGFGVVNKYNEIVIPLEFEEIRYWNDSSAFIKKNYDWKLYDMRSNEFIFEQIKSIQEVSSSEQELIAMLLMGNNFGLMSNKRGVLIPPAYQDIRNMGTQDSPFYLAEKSIEEADFYVLIYYNSSGVIVHKQAYEAADFEKIYCDDK